MLLLCTARIFIARAVVHALQWPPLPHSLRRTVAHAPHWPPLLLPSLPAQTYLLFLIGTRMRNTLMAVIYRKCLRLSNSALQVRPGAGACLQRAGWATCRVGRQAVSGQVFIGAP